MDRLIVAMSNQGIVTLDFDGEFYLLRVNGVSRVETASKRQAEKLFARIMSA
jgi:hypothetical protein